MGKKSLIELALLLDNGYIDKVSLCALSIHENENSCHRIDITQVDKVWEYWGLHRKQLDESAPSTLYQRSSSFARRATIKSGPSSLIISVSLQR